MEDTHYGDEDPECVDNTDLERDQELFEMARLMGWKPEEMRDREFAAKFAEWLKTVAAEE